MKSMEKITLRAFCSMDELFFLILYSVKTLKFQIGKLFL